VLRCSWQRNEAKCGLGVAQEALTRAQETIARMLQQARPGGRLADAAAGGALRGPFLAPIELQVLCSPNQGVLDAVCPTEHEA